MFRLLSRALIVASVGLLAGGASVAAWYARSPGFAMSFEADLPPVVAGIFRSERAGSTAFSWTSTRATVALPGVDRRVPWTCAIRARGARPPGVPPADLTMAADGVALDHRRLENDVYADIAVTVPARAAAGLELSIAVEPAFVPGPSDSRRLGAQLTALSCVPVGSAWPPTRAVLGSALSTALFGAALVLTGVSVTAAAAGAAALAVMAGLAVGSGAGPYGSFGGAAVATSAWIGAAMIALAWGSRLARRRPLGPAAVGALALSAGLLLVEMLGILHPSKTIVDAVFHAHRLEWVMSGRYLFTQPMPSGVRFPYAIALYVVSMPLGWVFTDHVSLLKVVVLLARAATGLLLYPVVVRAWGDRSTAVAAVGLFHLVPLPFVVIGNANMTYAFGQSAAVAAMAGAVLVGLSSGAWRATTLLFAAAAVAFLSHVGVFPLLLAVLLAAAAGYRWLGGPTLGRAAVAVASSALLAAVLSVALYYGHFGDAYRTLARVRAQPAASQAADTPSSGEAGANASGASLSLPERAAATADLGIRGFGWPLLALAAAGALLLGTGGWRDPLGIVIAATILVAVAFEAASAAAPVEPAFWRYTAEFISRVNYVAMPAVVLLAARAAARGWAAGGAERVASAVTVSLAVAVAVRAWLPWVG